jgi:TRAP-type C4-dicarboxylate transport system substrate-binding protein
VSGSAAAAIIEALGGTPVQMPANEMYNALQTGLIDGIVTGSSAISNLRLDEVADSYTIGAPLGRITFFVVMNQARYDGLSDAEKTAVAEYSGKWLSEQGEAAWNAYADEKLVRLTASDTETVVVLGDAASAAFGALTLPVTDRTVAAAGGEAVLAAMAAQ